MPDFDEVGKGRGMEAIESHGARSLRCSLGWHSPEPEARWNEGYGFTRCRRCLADLIRTASGRWHVPRGCRVVWSAERPAGALAGQATIPASKAELPIGEVLRHLNDHPPEAPPTGQDPPPSPAAGDPPAGPARPSEAEGEAVVPARRRRRARRGKD